MKEIELPDWQEFQHVDRDHILRRVDALEKNPAIALSFPDWLWQLGESELGPERWLNEAKAMHEQAGVYLRANTLKTNVEDLKKELAKDEIECEAVGNAGLRLLRRSNVFQHRLFKEGWFEVQDPGSQMISEFLAPSPGALVVDACAGAGGKSLHVAALMKNKGRVISMDIEEHKLEELKKRARRAGAFNIETRLIDGSKAIKSLEAAVDKLLLDVPCSGLGVLKRNPDAKWKLSPETIGRTRELQSRILAEYSMMVKAGGELVYSTCSVLPSENEGQVNKFLESNNKFQLMEEKTLLPSQGSDGFYMARLKRIG